MSGSTTTSDERSSTATTDSRSYPAADRNLRWGAYLLAVTGLMFLVHGVGFVYRALFVDAFELGVHSLGGVTPTELAASNPELAYYVDHLHVAIGGSYVAIGVAVAALAWYGVRRGRRWAYGTTILLPVLVLAISIPMHATGGFDYHTVEHLGPAGFGVPVLVVGAVLGFLGLRSTDDPT